jgi:hypothetical protein
LLTGDLGVVSLEGVILSEFEILTLFQFNSFSFGKESSSNFWSLGVKKNSNWLVLSLSEGGSKILDSLLVALNHGLDHETQPNKRSYLRYNQQKNQPCLASEDTFKS